MVYFIIVPLSIYHNNAEVISVLRKKAVIATASPAPKALQ